MDSVISNNQFKNNQYLFPGIFIRNLLMIYLWRQRNCFFCKWTTNTSATLYFWNSQRTWRASDAFKQQNRSTQNESKIELNWKFFQVPSIYLGMIVA